MTKFQKNDQIINESQEANGLKASLISDAKGRHDLLASSQNNQDFE